MAREAPASRQPLVALQEQFDRSSDPLAFLRALTATFLQHSGIREPSASEPLDLDVTALTPDVLGALFLRRLHQKSHSAYYTPLRIARHLARTVIHELVQRHTGKLEELRIVDPACGSGDLLVAAFGVLGELYAAAGEPPHLAVRNLFGVDLMPEAVEVARLRLQLAVAATLPRGSELPALPLNLRSGNALIGMRGPSPDPDVELLSRFQELGLTYEQVTWDEGKHAEGRAVRRPLTAGDVAALRPLHWSHTFGVDRFDAVIANPPWDIFKPNAREFFERYSGLVTKRRMSMEAFDAARAELLQDEEIRGAWLEYVSSYRHVSGWFRSAPQYRHQISTVNGRRVGTDTNLYKLFTEQSFNLLRDGGVAGLVLPSGIYTDLGAKGLRELLLDEATVTGLVGFENRRELFEEVHRSFKFVVLTYRKEGRTRSFPATFMQHSLDALDAFPSNAVELETDLIRRLSPDSLSLMELKTPAEVRVAGKLAQHPLLAGRVKLTSELHMTADRRHFHSGPAADRVPLFEGKMIWHYRSTFAPPRYWVDASRAAHEGHRLAIRAIASNTNERTLVATLLPKRVACGNSLLVGVLPTEEALYLLAVLNSFVADAFLRAKMTTNVNIFYLQQLPVPLFDRGSPDCRRLVQLAATLLCQEPGFEEIGLEGNVPRRALTEREVRPLRAEADALVARLYGLEAEEFVQILETFPLVSPEIRTETAKVFQERLTSG